MWWVGHNALNAAARNEALRNALARLGSNAAPMAAGLGQGYQFATGEGYDPSEIPSPYSALGVPTR